MAVVDYAESKCDFTGEPRSPSMYVHGPTTNIKTLHVKILLYIGIAPQGVIAFVSESWGGRISDKYLTEHCMWYSQKLLPGDVILADRDIADSVYRCYIYI